MTGKYSRLYSAYAVNAFGSWLTFLAIALITQEKYGAQYVAIIFLVQTLPSILFSRSAARMIPVGRQEQAFVVAQVILSLNCILLIIDQSLSTIFIHLFIGSFLRSISVPLLNSLIGKWVPREVQKGVFTRIGGLQSGTLAFAPMIGAWLKLMTSASVLFAVDALSFLISLILMRELLAQPSGETNFRIQWRILITELVPFPKDLVSETRHLLRLWFIFLVVGALLNAIEFPGFQIHRLSEGQISYALSAWGAGSLFAFIFPLRLSPTLSSGLLLAALTIFVWPLLGWIGVMGSFFLGGLATSYFSGGLRAQLQGSVNSEDRSISMWAYVNQITQFINLIAYASAGLWLTTIGFQAFSYLMLSCGLLLIILCLRSPFALEEKRFL